MGFKSAKKKFADLKKKIKEEKEKPGNSYSNENFFRPQMVKGEAKTKYRVRFLPLEDESPTGRPWYEVRFHMFEREGDNKYIKVIDPRTFDKNASNPIADRASKLYNSDNALDKTLANKLYRKPRYFVKVYIKEAPENQQDLVGKVLVYEANKTLYDKWIDEIEETDEETEAPFWDAEEGKDFIICMKTKGDWPDYSDSKFVSKAKPITDDEEEMERIYQEAQELVIKDKVLDRDPVKSGEELLEALTGGLKDSTVDTTSATDITSDSEVGSDEVELDDADFGDDDSDDDDTEDKASTDDSDDEDFNDDLDDIDISEDDFEIDE